MKKILYFLLLINIFLLSGCHFEQVPHVHEYVNGLCTCGQREEQTEDYISINLLFSSCEYTVKVPKGTTFDYSFIPKEYENNIIQIYYDSEYTHKYLYKDILTDNLNLYVANFDLSNIIGNEFDMTYIINSTNFNYPINFGVERVIQTNDVLPIFYELLEDVKFTDNEDALNFYFTHFGNYNYNNYISFYNESTYAFDIGFFSNRYLFIVFDEKNMFQFLIMILVILNLLKRWSFIYMKIYKFYITFLFVFLVMNLFIFSFPKVFANNAENQSNNFYNYSIELSDLFYQYSVGDCYIQSEMDSRNVSLEYEDTLNIVVSENEVISFLLKYKYYSDYVFTPNGTDVSLSGRPDPNMSYVMKYSTDFNDYIVEKMINYVNGLFPNSVLLSSPTTKFNCHSYAWYSHNVNSNDVWINNPCAYYMDSDRSYERIYNPRVGDIVCYMDTESDTPINIHSGIIVDYSGELDNNIISFYKRK